MLYHRDIYISKLFWSSRLNLSILLHAAAFISHLQWTAATYLLVKYNITHPLLTYLTITTLNSRQFSEVTRPNIPAVTSRQKLNVTKAPLRRTRTYTEGRTRGGSCPNKNLSWTAQILICGSVRRNVDRSYCAEGSDAADLIPA